MKKRLLYSGCILAAAGLFAACDDYLKEDAGDLLIPKKVEEFAPMMYAEGYPSNFNNEADWFVLMTDDVEMGHLEIDTVDNEDAMNNKEWDMLDRTSAGDGYEAYAWRENLGNLLMDDFWGARYRNIQACNTVIDALPTMEYVEQDSGKYNFLAAQAYAMRAYHYWTLVNTYAEPYSEANLDKPGVIIRTTPQIKIEPRKRSTIGEVYQLINKDMEMAEELIQRSTVEGNHHLLSRPAILLLASRIALFQEDWDEVIRTGEEFLKENAEVFDLNSVDTMTFGIESTTKAFCMMDGSKNKEIVFTFGNRRTYYGYLADYTAGPFYGLGFRTSHSAENSLMKSYEPGDLRKIAYFMKDVPAVKAENFWEQDIPKQFCYFYPIKYCKSASSGAEKPNDKLYHENWRSVEVMLNLAEAYTRKGMSIDQKALDLLNKLRQGRILEDYYEELTASDFNGAQDFLEFIWQERRRELCFEEAMRFWDMRRQGMPQQVHRWYSSWKNYETYVLPEGSKNYVLQIPEGEVKYNDQCVTNQREVITANK